MRQLLYFPFFAALLWTACSRPSAVFSDLLSQYPEVSLPLAYPYELLDSLRWVHYPALPDSLENHFFHSDTLIENAAGFSSDLPLWVGPIGKFTSGNHHFLISTVVIPMEFKVFLTAFSADGRRRSSTLLASAPGEGNGFTLYQTRLLSVGKDENGKDQVQLRCPEVCAYLLGRPAPFPGMELPELDFDFETGAFVRKTY